MKKSLLLSSFLLAVTGLLILTLYGMTGISQASGETLIIHPAHDTMVMSNYPTQNYGSDQNLQIQNAANNVTNSYLKFDISDVNAPVTTATLHLYSLSNSNDGGAIYAVSNYYKESSTPWTQTGLTWQNAPEIAGTPLSAAGNVKRNRWVEFDVTAAVQGNGTVSFGLTSSSSNGASYSAMEAQTYLPIIIVELGDASLPPTPIPTPTATPQPTSTPPPSTSGIWISAQELANLPTSGPAWQNLLAAAQQNTHSPNISDQSDNVDVYVLAKALVYARTGETRYRDEVVTAIMAAMGTEEGGRTLALGRNLVGYVIAADLVNLSANPTQDQQFRAWLRELLTKDLDGRTLQSTHELRPNNWGTHAGASRAAVAVYLGDSDELARTAQVFKGWLGDRNSYAGFKYGSLSWQCDPSKPVGINPAGCTINGHSVDGVLPDDQRRGGDFTWPPPGENYVWGALQGAVVQAEILSRAGYPTWQWEDQALLRAVNWLHEQANFPAGGDDKWQPWLVNPAYGTNFPAPTAPSPGKNMGWTDWTHAP